MTALDSAPQSAIRASPSPLALVVSGDIFTDYDYASLRPRLDAMALNPDAPHMHMVMVPNPTYHPRGDFTLNSGKLRLNGEPRVTFGNIALYRTSLFRELPRGEKLRMLPLYRDWINRGWATGECFSGRWFNIGTPGDLADLDRELRSTLDERPAARTPRSKAPATIPCSTLPGCLVFRRSGPVT